MTEAEFKSQAPRLYRTNLVVYKENDETWTVRDAGSSFIIRGLSWEQVPTTMLEVFEKAETLHAAYRKAFSARRTSISLNDLILEVPCAAS